MGGVVSAVPDRLTEFGRGTVTTADELGGAARWLASALADFAATRPEFGRIDEGLAAAVGRHALAAGNLGAWVARVGQAFRLADGASRTAGPAPGGNHTVTVATEAALARALRRDATPLRAARPAPLAAWHAAYNGPSCRATDARGGGFLTGPDGRRYPIGVPASGERHDQRWRVVAVEDGVAELGPGLPAWEALLVAIGAYGTHSDDAAPAGPRAYRDLWLPPPAPAHGSPPAGVRGRGIRTPEPPPDVPPSLGPQPPVLGVLSLAAGLAASGRAVSAARNQNLVATRVSYEVSDDGRRRATVRVFQVTEKPDGRRAVTESYARLDPRGSVVLEPVGDRYATAIGPASNGGAAR